MGTCDTQLTHANHAGEGVVGSFGRNCKLSTTTTGLSNLVEFTIFTRRPRPHSLDVRCALHTQTEQRECVCDYKNTHRAHCCRHGRSLWMRYRVWLVITPDYQIKFHNRFVCIFVFHFLFHFIFSSLFVSIFNSLLFRLFSLFMLSSPPPIIRWEFSFRI